MAKEERCAAPMRTGPCGRRLNHPGRHIGEAAWANHIVAAAEWQTRNLHLARATGKRWEARNPTYYRDRHLRKSYGLTEEDVDAMRAEQGGLCAVCREDPAVAIDHDHNTGAVRGLTCHNCNLMLGNAKEDPARLLAGVAYLERAAKAQAEDAG
jgi:hypothetical protein